jgi:Zn-dependent protease with chaperone function
MSFINTWLIPRVAFWLMWTAWLVCLRSFLERWDNPHTALLLILALPLLITWIGSRFAKNPFDTPSALFWKGAAVSCGLGVFATVFLMRQVYGGIEILGAAFVLCGYMAVRGTGVSRMEVKQGDLFKRTQAIARQTGVSVARVVVFKSPSNMPTAFAHRMGAVMLSDSLLRLLARQETDTVIAHEAAHLRPAQRTALALIPMIAVPSVMVHFFYPGALASVPFWPLLFILLWRAVRRRLEFDADATAIRITREPESLITGLTRISHASGFPMHWGRLAGLFMAHPPMTARFRAIARRAGLSDSRVKELMSIAVAIPALPGYTSPFAEPQPVDSAILAAHRDGLQKHMTLLSRAYPIFAGVAASVIVTYWGRDFATLLALSAASILAAVAIYCATYEVLVGLERRRVRRQLPGDDDDGYFVGLSTAAEPRTFDGMYHYDLGMARIDAGSLSFTGLRSAFCLRPSDVRRVWMANGPRHWTPRKTVCVEYENQEHGLSVISMQSLERWFWPGTSQAANKLLLAVTSWFESGVASDRPFVTPPQVTGAIVSQVPVSAAWKSLKMSCLISFAGGWVISSFALMESSWSLFAPLIAPTVTAIVILFALSPHLKFGSMRAPDLARPQSD